jgi:hypothetical protein
MPSPRLCAGGVRLREQIDARWPKRDKASDGWIGDTAHQARGSASDHNPDAKGIVHAIDVDENLGAGIWRNGKMAQRLADELLLYARSSLPGADRVKYVVYEQRLASGTYRSTWWKWRPGNWGHTAHIHVSFTSKADGDGRAWPLPVLAASTTQARAWADRLLKATR